MKKIWKNSETFHLIKKKGIDTYYDLVKTAGEKMPEDDMKRTGYGECICRRLHLINMYKAECYSANGVSE